MVETAPGPTKTANTTVVLGGLEARILNVHADDIGGPYNAVFANAVLLHVSRLQLRRVLEVALHSTRVGGVLTASFKKGTGEGWSAKKLNAPRHFTYWQEEDLRRVVLATGWPGVLRNKHHAPKSFVFATSKHDFRDADPKPGAAQRATSAPHRG